MKLQSFLHIDHGSFHLITNFCLAGGQVFCWARWKMEKSGKKRPPIPPTNTWDTNRGGDWKMIDDFPFFQTKRRQIPSVFFCFCLVNPLTTVSFWITEKILPRWFNKVTAWSASWRSFNPFKRSSFHHSKKVTGRIARSWVLLLPFLSCVEWDCKAKSWLWHA